MAKFGGFSTTGKKWSNVTVEGFDRVQRNLNVVLENMKVNSTEGLTDVAKQIHRDADLIPPKIPRDTGNLRHSRFIVNKNGQVAWGSKASFKPRGKGKWGGGDMQAHHQSVINKYKMKAKVKEYPYVIYGYSAPYAVYVHEMGIAVRGGRNINWTRPGSGAKFFQAAIANKAKSAKGILYQHVNIRGKRKPVKGVKYGSTIGNL